MSKAKINVIEWYQEHINQTVDMVCRWGHSWVTAVPDPRDINTISGKKASWRCCPLCVRQKRIWPSKVHPEMTGAFDAAVRLGGADAFYNLKPVDVMKLWRDEYAMEWRAALALAALMAKKIARVG